MGGGVWGGCAGFEKYVLTLGIFLFVRIGVHRLKRIIFVTACQNSILKYRCEHYKCYLKALINWQMLYSMSLGETFVGPVFIPHTVYMVYLDLETKFEWESRMEIDPINLWKLSSATFVLFEVYSFPKEKSCKVDF